LQTLEAHQLQKLADFLEQMEVDFHFKADQFELVEAKAELVFKTHVVLEQREQRGFACVVGSGRKAQ
jgi:hypothetical protein